MKSMVAEKQSGAVPAEDALATRGRILIVDDEEVISGTLHEFLQGERFEVATAADMPGALALVESYEQPIHLLVSDVVMPTLGGLELVRRLRALNPRMRVILISGFPERAPERDDPPQVDGFLQKPFAPHVLLEKARAVLDAR